MKTALTQPTPEGGTSDDALVRRAVARDGDAFTELYDRHVEAVYRHIAYRAGGSSDVEDLTQEVFIRAWRAIDRYRPGERPFLAWLYTIAHNLVVDYYRSKGRRPQVSLDGLERVEEEQADPGMDGLLDMDSVRRLLTRLPGDQQQVLMLRFVEGLEHGEVARAMGKSEGAVRALQLRALRRLRQMLTAEGTRE